MNPIGKFRFKGVRRWGYKCPHCGEIHSASPSYYSGIRGSRKTAKDALHSHILSNHGGPGLEV